MANLDATDSTPDNPESTDQGIFSSCNWSNQLITKFSQRLVALEKLVAQTYELLQTANLSTLPQILLDLENKMSAFTNALDKLTAQDQALDAEVTALATSVSGVGTVVSNQAATIAAQQATITDLQNQLANGEPVTADQIAALQANIDDMTAQNASLDAANKALQAALPTSKKSKPAVRPTHLG